MIKTAFICIHNSCRSQIAEALCRYFWGNVIECYSAGTETKPNINEDAVRIMKQIYGIDMEKTQYSKLLSDIPPVDIVITMGCNVACPFLPCKYREDWGLDDPTGKSDEEFIKVIQEIESKVLDLPNVVKNHLEIQTAHWRTAIQSPELLYILKDGAISYGAHQLWYSGRIQKLGGCGPTTASNLLWYLTATRPKECGGLYSGNGTTYTGMLGLMREVWQYIKPGMRGVDKSSAFIDGAIRFGKKHGITLKARSLEISKEVAARPKPEQIFKFLTGAFASNLPVAFLNLSNGAVRNLDNWHWVTLISVNQELQAEMYDQEVRQNVDIRNWLATTTGGGAFVILEPENM